MSSKEPDVKNAVLEKIEAGEVDMKSKRYFGLAYGALIAGFVFLAVQTGIFISLALFQARQRRLFDLLEFGPPGRREFALNFPVALVVLAVICLGLLVYLEIKFKLNYRQRLWVVAIATIVPVVVIASVITASGFNRPLNEFGPYQRLDRRGLRDNTTIVRGKVLAISDSTVTINTGTNQQELPIGSSARGIGLLRVGDTAELLLNDDQEVIGVKPPASQRPPRRRM